MMPAHEDVNFDLLSSWMDDVGLPRGTISDRMPLGGGTQNVLIRFSRGGHSYVLRLPPSHKRENSDETMRREARVLSALAGSDVPHPRLVAACSDPELLGAAFYLMEPVDGMNPTVELPTPYLQHQSWCHQLGLAVVDGAAAIGAVDYEAIGLGDLGRPDGFLERQVRRWRTQLESYRSYRNYPGPGIVGIERVEDWLDENRPTMSKAGLMHGDYHLANVLCSPDHPGLAAIVDWELATIGDPLLDLGWLLATWPSPEGLAPGTIGAEPWKGFPVAAELVERYRARTERDMSAISWYTVLACYKMGIILEGSHARSWDGQATKQVGERLHRDAVGLFQRAVAVIASS